MILTKADLLEYINADAKASGRTSVKAKFWGDDIWKFCITLRKSEYYANKKGFSRYISLPLRLFYKMQFHNRSLRLGFSIPINVFGKGLAIVHYGTIVVAKSARIGENCRIHEGVTIGATNGSGQAA